MVFLSQLFFLLLQHEFFHFEKKVLFLILKYLNDILLIFFF
jgi:hypothetical protein